MKLPISFNNGKIYIIRFLNNDNHIYIGSTIHSLKKRYAGHKCTNNTTISKYVTSVYNNDWSKCMIELYLNYPCKSSRELVKKEYQIINKFARNKNYKVLNIKGNKHKK